MTQIHNIRELYFSEGKKLSEIARETGHDRKTIREYINKDDWNEKSIESINEPTFPKLEAFKSIIDSWLVEDLEAKKKQRHTAKRVYVRLRTEHSGTFDCSYRTVAGYVAQKKKEIYGKNKGFLPLEHIPGEAQLDFGESEYFENGTLRSGHHLNLSFPYSNRGFTQLLPGENQECLFEGLIGIFEHMGAVPKKIWFDNASTIVTKILKSDDRVLTDAFLRFAEHYGFQYVFCNPYKGNEKGNVENKVGYHRRNMLVPRPRLNNLSDFNAELLRQCDEDAERLHYRKDGQIDELYESDKERLLPLPAVPLNVSRYVTVKTNAYGRFYLEKGLHEYSVSPKFASSKVLVEITANEVIPFDENQREITRHKRLYGGHKQQSMNWLPYLTQLSRHPRALKYTGIYQMLPQSMQKYLESCSNADSGKILKAIATLTEKSGFDNATMTIERALLHDARDVESLINLHRLIHDNVVELPPLRLAPDVPLPEQINPDLRTYDKALRVGGDGKC